MSKVILFMLFTLISLTAQSQQQEKKIAGQLLTADSLTFIPYVSIKNLTLKQATISNEEGYFQLPVFDENDSIVIASFEYETVRFKVENLNTFFLIYLEPKTKKLDAVTVRPQNQDPLIKLLLSVKNTPQTTTQTAKSYFYLRTYQDTNQIELIEGYYNLTYKGYDITDINLKAGRLGLTAVNDRYFSSHNSVKAIVEMKLLQESDLFMFTPLTINRKKIGEQFHLQLQDRFADENGDSIAVIRYTPKFEDSENFSGTIWLNESQRTAMKIVMECENCKKHPFKPIFPLTDSIANINLRITKTFQDQRGRSTFEHVDLAYSLDYFSRKNTDHARNYSISSNAVLFVYDAKHPFVLPYFDIDADLSDYLKINAFTYNPFFWNTKNEFSMNQQEIENQRYFSSPTTLTNSDFFKTFNNDTLRNSNLIRKKGISESQFVHWSPDRIVWRDLQKDSLSLNATSAIIANRYNLEVQFYFDWNNYQDSVNVLTDVIFDPYKSYYHLPIDAYTTCFINMYFDLCEIQRRELQKKFNHLNKKNVSAYFECFYAFQTIAEKERQRFLLEIDRGTNERNLLKWNRYIYEQLNINNVQIFLGN
ncbi:MAG: hypothetical protein RLZ33_1040 [Bacteroidota bacterium]